MPWPWKRYAELRRRAEEARAEAEESRRRLNRTRDEVVQPLRRADQANRFATLIRESLLDGR